MITFVFACIGLVLFSAVFYMLPRRARKENVNERSQSNLDWYRLRESELAGESDDALLRDAKLRLLEDLPGEELPQPKSGSKVFQGWLLLPLIAIASAVLYYYLGAAQDVAISDQLSAIGEEATAEEIEALMLAIESRSAQRPNNLYYRALLGRFYMGKEDYERAAQTYSALAIEAPDDAQILAFAAQAQYLASNRELGDTAKMLAEQALAANPQQRTALGLLGMASFEQGQYRAAIEYWQRLLALEPEGSEAAQMIASVVQRARQKLGENGGDSAEQAPVAAVTTAGVTLRVSLPTGAEVAPTATVFVLARAANSDSRMPIAVQRLQASDLPAELRLDDRNSMAGQKLSETESIVVIVQLSPDGKPGEANATWLGEAGPLAPSTGGDIIEISLFPRN